MGTSRLGFENWAIEVGIVDLGLQAQDIHDGAGRLADTSTIEPVSPSTSSADLPRPATDAEISALPHVVDHIPFAAWAVIFAGAFERFTYFGLIAPWQNYMQNPRPASPASQTQNPHDDAALPGALGLGQATATNISNAFFLCSFLTPMLFAVVSDTRLGRYKTLMLGLACYLTGCVVLVGTSSEGGLDRGAGVPGLGVSMVFVALGAGCVKAVYVPFLGDQLNGERERVEVRKGREVVVSRERTLQFVYNAYYWFTNIASLSAVPVTYMEREFGFWQAYLLTTVALAVGIALFAALSPKFVRIEPQGNVLPDAIKTLTCAAKNGFKLDNAKASYQEARHGRMVPWSDGFVEEIKKGLVACRVIFSLLVFYLVISQIYNNFVSQAGSMQLSGIPNDLAQAFSGVACIIFGPLLQGLYSLLAKHRIRFGPMARLTTAFVFCGLSMAYAAIVQHLIYSAGPCYDRPFQCAGSAGGKEPNRVSIWVQIPVYFLLAIGEILGFVTAFEYAYSKAPKEMKAVVMAFSQLTAGLASVLGMAISPAAKDPNMVIMYGVLAGCMGATAGLFWWTFGELDLRDRELNQLVGVDGGENGIDRDGRDEGISRS
ncbi:major facilitator superfamily domain-containing protein [Massariosphaeria phaeospora]|uniref:Major facilitator superfamily domain-containing protein n=1 Tax=Massariosphaeria phaeospora TaxID=100035 RepID=A0A7C8I0T5_9PLEO|nr:major facilitator superfamily domain-containing protein [Massariosphaeria phaeospora]